MEIRKFDKAHEMVAYLASLSSSERFRIAKSIGVKPKDKEEAHLYADYIVQGVSKGLTGASLVQYAEANVARLQATMPHLKGAKPVVTAGASVVVPVAPSVATSKKPSVAKPKAKVAKVKHPDFTIVARPDRGGFEGWFGGRAEAFRSTEAKVQAFFQKKYQQSGQLLK